MQLNIATRSQRTLPDGSREWLLQVPAAQLVLLGFLLEALEGWCSYSTVERGSTCVLRITAPPHWQQSCAEFLEILGKY